MEQCFDCGHKKNVGKSHYRAWCPGCQKVSNFGTLDQTTDYEYCTLSGIDNWLDGEYIERTDEESNQNTTDLDWW